MDDRADGATRSGATARGSATGRRLAPLALVLAVAAGAGCATTHPEDPGPADVLTPDALPAPGARDRGLEPGDAIRIRVWRDTTLSGEYPVERDGTAVLPILGRRTVTGIPTDSLERLLIEDLGEFIEVPPSVTVLRRVAIVGSVNEPGLYSVDPTVSVMEALATAGGITPEADRRDVRLVRGEQVFQFNLNEQQRLQRVTLESGDQIFIDRRGWLSRNWQFVTSSLLGFATTLAVIIVD